MKSLLLTSILVLNGCSAYTNKFDCPYGKGLGCTSISKVNHLIDRQQIDFEEGDQPSQKTHKVHVYFGPNHMGRLMDILEPES